MTETEMRNLIDGLSTEVIDLIQAVLLEMDKVNFGEIALIAGSHTIAFADYNEAYLVDENYHFTIKEAISDDGGYDIGCTISNRTKDGFDVLVEEACTFTFETVFRKQWISD